MRKILLIVPAMLFLSGCITDKLPFMAKGDYRLAGMEGDEDTRKHLSAIIKDRLEQRPEEGEDANDAERREDYYEQMIQGDLVKAMYARGYYEAKVEYADDAEKLSGVYEIVPGPLYRIKSVAIEPGTYRQYRDLVALDDGEALGAEAVLKAQEALHKAAQQDRCYYSMEVTHQVVLDQKNHTGAITFNVAAGPEAALGDVIFEGSGSVKISYLEKLIPWRQGDCYRADKIEDLRSRLLESGLFVQAETELPDAPMANGEVPVIVRLKERSHRTIRAGLSYYTDEGIGTTLGWEHRNLLGAAEKLQAELSLSQLKQSIDVDLTKPFFMRKDQSLSFNTSLRRQDTDAFKETGFDIGTALNRNFTPRLSGSTGIAFTLSDIEDEEKERKTFALVSLPNTIAYDTRDNKLDAHKGWNLSAGVTPFFDALGESSPFVKTQMSAATYLGLGTPRDIVLAARISIGSILGPETEEIPATERFYAGGGGSVRGFGYQEIGPQEDGTPTGGRSLVTATTELRYKITDTLGGVVFVDGGSVGETAAPTGENFAIGAGIGVRYFTGFGPLRFDIATPLTQKDDLEQNYQFYISIGQAF